MEAEDAVFAEVAETGRIIAGPREEAHVRTVGTRCGTAVRRQESNLSCSGLHSVVPAQVRDGLAERRERWTDTVALSKRHLPGLAAIADEALGVPGLRFTAEMQWSQQSVAVQCDGLWLLDDRHGWRIVLRAMRGTQVLCRREWCITDVGDVEEDQRRTAGFGRLVRGMDHELRLALTAVRERPVVEGPIVLLPSASAAFVHEVFGHLLEGPGTRGSPWSVGEGTATPLSPQLTILSDPTSRKSWGRCSFDDEGTPTMPLVLVEQGAIVGRLLDRQSGGTSGSVRRTSWDRPPRVRQSHTVLAPGLAPLRSGDGSYLHVDTLVRGEVSRETGQFACMFGRSWRRVGDAVEVYGPAWLSGDAATAGRNVLGVGDMTELSEGGCGVGADQMPVSFEAPDVILDTTGLRVS